MAKKMFGKKTLAFLMSLIMVIGLFTVNASAARGGNGNGPSNGNGPGNGNGGYTLDEDNYKASRTFGWDTYSQNATLRDTSNRDVYSQITVKVGSDTLTKGRVNSSVSNADVVANGVTISNIPAGYYISAYKIVCAGKYGCETDHDGNATDETVSLDAGQGSYTVSITKADLGHANHGADCYWILIELSAFRIEDEEVVTYPYNILYNYGELADELAAQPATADPNTYVINSTATILAPNSTAAAAAAALGYEFVEWQIEKVEGIQAVTSVVGTKMDPADTMTITGETTLKAIWEKVPTYTLTVKHLDAETLETVAETQTSAGLLENSAYTTAAVVVEDYEAGSWDATSDAAAGTMTADKTVVYLYEKKEVPPPPQPEPNTYTLTVLHLDADTMVPVADAQTTAGLAENTPYTTYAVNVNGYEAGAWVETSDTATGTMTSNKTVIYVYTREEETPPTPPTPPVIIRELGDLTITKIAVGAETPADTIFIVENEGNYREVSYSEFVNGSYTFYNLNVGTYTVTEINAEVEGYTLTVTAGETVTVTDGDVAEFVITNTYTAIEVPPPGGENPPSGGGEDPTVEIPDEDVPLVEIPDEEPPLADVPETGDPAMLYVALTALSGFGLAWMGKKKSEEE